MTDTPQTWLRDGYTISTDRKLLQPDAINAALDSDIAYWANALSSQALIKALDRSVCFGLYMDTPDSENTAVPAQVGLARLITDEVTFAYLTDVYVLRQYQGRGLGKWLIDCVQEWLESLPELRRALLATSSEASIRFYQERMNMGIIEQGKAGLVFMGCRGPGSVLQN